MASPLPDQSSFAGHYGAVIDATRDRERLSESVELGIELDDVFEAFTGMPESVQQQLMVALRARKYDAVGRLMDQAFKLAVARDTSYLAERLVAESESLS